MLRSPQGFVPPVALGLASVVLGTIGLMFFPLPILAIPIAAASALLGIVGMLLAGFGTTSHARLSAAGFVVSCLALAVGFGLQYAPIGYEPSQAVPRLWQRPPVRPYVPPPMRPAAGPRHDRVGDPSDAPPA
jgi:hypothetical protein